MENIGEKNPPGPTNFYPSNLGGKLGRKERKLGLALELHIYPLQVDVLYVIFFSFFILFYYGNLRACDLWVRSLTPCIFLLLKKKNLFSFVFIQHPFFFQLFCLFFLFFEIFFLGSWTSYPLFFFFF